MMRPLHHQFSTGVVEMVARDFESPADSGSNNVYNYTLIATDDDGNSEASLLLSPSPMSPNPSLSLSGIADSNQAFRLHILPPSLSGTPIGSVTYTLGGDDAGLFTVNSSTGVVEMVAHSILKAPPILDPNVYNYTLIATDDDGNSDSLLAESPMSPNRPLSHSPESPIPIKLNSAYTSATPSLSGTPISRHLHTRWR